MSTIRIPPRQSNSLWSQQGETLIPDDELPEMDARQASALLDDAIDLGLVDKESHPMYASGYRDGWGWGATCGATGAVALFAACIAAGKWMGWLS